jgi:hypothetical protein
MWFKYVLFGVFVLNVVICIYRISKGDYVYKATPGSLAISCISNTLFAVGILWLL